MKMQKLPTLLSKSLIKIQAPRLLKRALNYSRYKWLKPSSAALSLRPYHKWITMDLTIIGVMLIIGPSFQSPAEYTEENYAHPISTAKNARDEVLSRHGVPDESFDYIEDKLNRMNSEESPLLANLFRQARNPSAFSKLQKREAISSNDEEYDDFIVEKSLEPNRAINIKLLPRSVASLSAKQKREVRNNQKDKTNSADNYIEEKLSQHTEALEYLLKIAHKNEALTKRLVENLKKQADQPALREKMEIEKYNRRSSIENGADNPFVRLGKVLPKYGSLIRTLVVKQVQDTSDPTPLVESERDAESEEAELEPQSEQEADLRNAFYERPDIYHSAPNVNMYNQWCNIAALCRKTQVPVCGYDDRYGYSKFEDNCHMLDVNCYYKYNFVIVPSCNPSMYSFRNTF